MASSTCGDTLEVIMRVLAVKKLGSVFSSSDAS